MIRNEGSCSNLRNTISESLVWNLAAVLAIFRLMFRNGVSGDRCHKTRPSRQTIQ